ncbi:ABC transporter permease [Bacillus chungangensis]|uniref:Transport permease protein n=1 Tax=Bacillus chungangensis TaxID=587633 RepID=A0ABT9WTS8_9BACI|nr:ABC transporter permease [Bacillus chungangensis]MDQ0176637.1 ABC-2 type transport system permease protein [Bacillus chungangensis]
MNFFKLVKFDFMNILRNPFLVISNTLLPLILIGIMGFVTKSSFGTELTTSYDYYGVKMVIFSVAVIAMTASNAFMEEKVIKGNLRIVYVPVSKTEIYLSKVVSSYILATFSYGLLLPIGQFLLQINYGGKNIFYVMLVLNFFSLFGCCLGTMFCCIFKNEERANAIMQIPLALFIFFGGLFFQIHRFGKVINDISIFSPIKWVVDCTFRIIYDNDFQLFLPVLLFLLLASVVCIVICQIIFRPEEYV